MLLTWWYNVKILDLIEDILIWIAFPLINIYEYRRLFDYTISKEQIIIFPHNFLTYENWFLWYWYGFINCIMKEEGVKLVAEHALVFGYPFTFLFPGLFLDFFNIFYTSAKLKVTCVSTRSNNSVKVSGVWCIYCINVNN